MGIAGKKACQYAYLAPVFFLNYPSPLEGEGRVRGNSTDV
jgi:hypothetical protein